MGLKGNPQTLQQLKSKLRRMPVSVAHDVARRASPEMTRLAQSAYDSGRTVYDQPRPRGVNGDRLTLDRSGRTRQSLFFTTTGTIVRAVLGTPYAKYLIGKYDVLPNGPLPQKWKDRLSSIVKDTEVKL